MRALALLMLGSAFGCAVESPVDTDTDTDPATTPAACAAGDLVVEIGTGTASFEPLADGGEVMIVHGPQGGWHVDVSARVANTNQTVVLHPGITLDATGEMIAGDQQDAYVALAGYADCAGDVWGQRCYVDDHVPTDLAFVCSLAGQSATITVDVTDPETGRTISAEKQVTLTVDPVDDCS